MATKTPSQSKQQTLDNINMIVGQIAQSEELSNTNIEEIDEKLGKKGLEDVILGLDIIAESIITSANMLVAIAGYLFGEKGINATTGFAQLTSKIKNTAPILGETPFNFSDETSKPSSEGIIDVIISGVDGKSIDSLVELIQQLNSNFYEGGAEAIESIAETIQLLSKVTEALNNVDFSNVKKTTYNNVILLSQICESVGIAPGFNTKLPKDNIEDISNSITTLSKLVNNISNIDFTNIKSTVDDINNLNNIISKLANIEINNFNKNYLNNINQFSIALDSIFNIDILKSGIDKNVLQNIINSQVYIEALKVILEKLIVIESDITKATNVISPLVKLIEDFSNVEFDKLSKNLKNIDNLSDIIDKLKALDIKDFNKTYLNRINMLSTIISTLFSISVFKDGLDNDIIKNIKNFQKNIVLFTSSLENIISAEKTIKDSIETLKVLNEFLNGFSNINFKAIKDFSDNLDNLCDIVITLSTLYISKFDKDYLERLDIMSDAVSKLFSISIFNNTNKDISNNILNAQELIKNLDVVVNSLSKMDFNKFDDKFVEEIDNFSNTIYYILYSCDVIQEIIKINEEEDFLEVKEFVDNLNDNVINKLITLDFSHFTKDSTDNLKAFNSYVLTVVSTASILSKSLILIEIVNDSIDSFKDYAKNLAEFISGNNGKGGLVMVMNRITKAIDNGLDLKVINNFFTDLTTIIKTITKLGLISILACMFTPMISISLKILNNIIEKVGEIDIKEITTNTKNIHELANFLDDLRTIFVSVTICGLLALPAFIGAVIMRFAASFIIEAIQVAIDNINKITSDSKKIESIKEFTKVILIIGGIMLIAALVGGLMLKYWMNVLGFTLLLAGFILAVGGVLVLLSKFVNAENLKAISALTNIIVACALVMMIGALFMLTGLWKESLLFGATLMGFIMMIMIPFVLMSIFFKKAIKGAKDICELIITCTLVMLVGALFMMIPGLSENALKFGLILTGFITMILVPMFIFTKFGGKKAVKAIDDIKQLVITCSIVMIIGALFMFIPGFGTNALLFAALVAGFVNAIVIPFALVSKKLKKAQGALWGLMAIIIVSSLVLMIGANYIREYGWEDIAIFGTTLVLFIGVIGGAAWVLGKISKDLFKGLAAMACIVGISMLFGITLKMVAEACQMADPLEMLAMVGIIAAIILVIGGLSVALGALSAIPPVSIFFWAGIAAMAAVSGIAVMFSHAVKNIAEAAKLMAEASNMGFEIGGALEIVGGMISIGQAVGAAALALPVGLILFASISFKSMARMISEIGKAVGEISNLTVGTAWDSDGNAIAFRQLSKQDFDNAAENTKTIITTLGYAICDIYKDNKELFEVPMITEKTWWGGTRKVSGKKTIFQTVVEACSSMGTMLSLIGKGVADVASLKVAEEWNDDGKPTKFRHLKENDFTAAANNTKTIITTLGYAICDIYKDNKELFEVPMVTEKTWWGGTRKVSGKGPTVFEKVTNACSSLGNMLSLIAKGVGDVANLQVADEWNSDGKPIHFRHLTTKDFAMAAFNTSLIVRTLGAALAQTYNENQDFFATSLTFVDGKIQGDTPIIRVINAGTAMGQMVSSIAAGVQDIANLRMPTKWDKDGNAIEWREMTPQDFTAAGEKVTAITTVLATALGDVYKKNPKLFDPVTTLVKTKDGWFSDTYETRTEDAPMVKVLKAAGGLGAFISDCAEAVMKVADLKFENKDGKKIQITINDLQPGGKVSKNIVAVTTCLGLALNDAYFKGNYKSTVFNPEWDVYKKLPEAVKLGINIIEQCLGLLETVEEKIGASKPDKTLEKWGKMIKGVFEPFTDDTKINDTSIKRLKEVGASNYDGLDQLITSVNKIDNSKADKFIELTRELSNLSVNFGNMQGIVDALNGKINETLTDLASKLEFAALAIKKSDESQNARQKLIDKNIRKITTAMKTPMTVNVKKDSFGNSGSGGLGLGGNTSTNYSGNNNYNVSGNSGSFDTDILSDLLDSVNAIKRKIK